MSPDVPTPLTMLLEIEAPGLSTEPGSPDVYALQMVLKELRAGKPRLARDEDANLLRYGESFLAAAIANALDNQYSVLCLSDRSNPKCGVIQAEDVRSQLSSITWGEPRFPIIFWLVPSRDPTCALAVVDACADSESKELLRIALRAGALWVSISDVFLDVLTLSTNAHLLLNWLRTAEMESTVAIRWRIVN